MTVKTKKFIMVLIFQDKKKRIGREKESSKTRGWYRDESWTRKIIMLLMFQCTKKKIGREKKDSECDVGMEMTVKTRKFITYFKARRKANGRKQKDSRRDNGIGMSVILSWL